MIQTTNEQLHILLVEDDPDDADLTVRAIGAAELRNPVLVARDVPEALARIYADLGQAELRLPLPGLILLDLKLPGDDGLDLLRRLKADRRLRRVPVVMFTSSRDDGDVNRSFRLGANSYVVKPVSYARLVEMMRGLVHYWLGINCLPGAKRGPAHS